MSDDQDLSGKELMKSIKSKVSPEEKRIDEEKLQLVRTKLSDLLPQLKDEFNNEIPFSAIHDRTEIPYELIHHIIMDMLMKKDILGFINDKSTSELSDDVLIIREKRILDDLEPNFRTG